MEKNNLFLIEGGLPLKGEVEISGSKNAALAIISAGLLTSAPSIIKNIPLISDIFDLIELAKQMGAEIQFLDKKTIKVFGGEKIKKDFSFSLFEKTRGSILLLPYLIKRFKEIRIPPPGGDKIGLRPITTQIDFLNQLGIKVEKEGFYYYLKKPKKFISKKIILEEFSVTSSEIALTLLSTIDKNFSLSMIAAEPHVQDLCLFLQKAGAKIKGIGSHFIEIRGSQKLKGVEMEIPADYLEAGTFLIAFAITKGKGKIKNIRISDLDYFLKKMEKIGVNFERKKNSIWVKKSNHFFGTKIQSLPHPGFPTDLQPQTSVLLTISQGKSLIHEPLYENRFLHLHELKKMGADIEITDPHRAIIFGKKTLNPEKLNGSDIRSTASLVLASLIPKGKSYVSGIEQIKRGFENFDKKLQKLGARIEIV
ncbi:MAG: UDP-N-acetylglucosamine 1-carboxyvinyltransferase [Minisyncoccales bacterium]